MAAKYRFIGALLAMLLTSVVMCDTTLAQKKPKPSDPPVTLPPIQYQIRLFTLPGAEHTVVQDMNNLGQVVGSCLVNGQKRAFLFDAVADNPGDPIGVAVDLNEIVDPSEIPEHYVIGRANGINDSGDIVGFLLHQDGVTQLGYVIKMNATDQDGTPIGPQLHLIPGDVPGRYTYTKQINNNGDVLGAWQDGDTWRYYWCNPGWYADGFPPHNIETPLGSTVLSSLSEVGPMIAGRDSLGAFRITLGVPNATEIFPWGPPGRWKHNTKGGTLKCMNADGTFCCESWIENEQGKIVYAPYLIRADGSFRQLEAGTTETRYPNVNSPFTINGQEDVLVEHIFSPGGVSLHHAELHTGFEALTIMDLIVETRQGVIGPYSDLDIWLDSKIWWKKMSDRAEITTAGDVSSIHFGEIAGWIGAWSDSEWAAWTDQTDIGFLLTPVPKSN